jgi:hypothetical protein
LHLGVLDSGVCAVLCIMVSIAGGALALRKGALATSMGGLIAVAPAPLLLLLLARNAESAQSLPGMIHHLPPVDRTFLGLLALFGLSLWLAAIVSRNIGGAFSQRHSVQYWRTPTANESAAWQVETRELSVVGRGSVREQAPAARGFAREEDSQDDPILLTRTKTSPPKDLDFALAPTVAVPLTHPVAIASEPTSRISVWSFHDAPPRPEDFELPPLAGRGTGIWFWLSLIAVTVVALGAGAWWMMQR